jgi:enoyl-[acyl-carrier protein] reductase II
LESSSHENYKKAVIDADDGSTVLTLKKVTPVRLVKTPFASRAVEAEHRGDSKEQLQQLLGRKREMMGIFEGNVEEGEIEAGQSSGLIKEILPAGEVVRKTMEEYYSVKQRMP